MPAPTHITIVRANPAAADQLTAIAVAAKADWGYPASWIERWREQLTFTPEYVATNPTFAAIEGQSIVGCCAVRFDAEIGELDHLWVLPAAMGRGIGRALFGAAEAVARDQNALELRIVSDPHAERFYLRMRALVYDRRPAFVDGHERYLPLLRKSLTPGS